MAHRIYLYNYDRNTNQSFDTYLGEWNYEIPLLLYPLIAEDIKKEGLEFFSDRKEGIIQLRYFFDLLADTYQLHDKKSYYEPVNAMFEFLEALPYDSFVMNATDVFNMNEEKHSVQAKEWVQDIYQRSILYKKAIEKKDLSVLDVFFSRTGYSSFLEILQTDWINYGFGYFEEWAYKKISSSVFEENGKFGLKDMKGCVVAPPIYDEIFDEDYYFRISIIKKDELFGYLRSDGKELIAPIYENATDVFDFEEEPMGEVRVKGKAGVLNVYTGCWSISPDYDTLDIIKYGYLGVERNGRYGVYQFGNKVVIPVESESPYQHDYDSDVFFAQKKDSTTCSYYTLTGDYLGDFAEGNLVKAASCFWIKPNRLYKKGRLMNGTGQLIIDEIDRLMHIENFDVLALRQGDNWKIYHPEKAAFLLSHESISNVKGAPDVAYKKNVFVLQTQAGLGLFDADAVTWLIAPHIAIKHINYLENGFLSIQKKEGYYWFDFDSGLSADCFDYISNPLNYTIEEGLLFLYREKEMYQMAADKTIQLIAVAEYGEIYVNRHSFRGADLVYFTSFYDRWKKQSGKDAEQYMTVETIQSIAYDAKENQQYEEALRLFELAAQKNDVDSLVEMGLLLTDPEIVSLFDPRKGISCYEKAAKQNNAVAWNNIGALYQNGVGYRFNIKKAIQAYQRAADLGDGMALANLGDLYYFGVHVRQNYDKALGFYLKAEKKYFYNYDKISEIYYRLRDYVNLLVYLKKDYDRSYSSIYYGIIYEQGMGVKADLKKAISYFEQANANSAYEYATQRLVHYYGEDPIFKNEKKFLRWKTYAEQQGIDIE